MHRHSSSTRSAGVTAKAVGFAVGLLGLLASFVLLASPASAHHPEISGSTACGTVGNVDVTYTASTWELANAQATNYKKYVVSQQDIANIGIPPGEAQPKGSVLLEYLPTGADEFTPSNWVTVRSDMEFVPGAYTVTGTTAIAEAAFPIKLRVRVIGFWKSGAAGKPAPTAPGQLNASQTTAPLAAPVGCYPPENDPSATAEVACSTSSIAVTLDNSRSAEAQDFVVSDGTTSTTYTVAAGATQVVTVPAAEDTTVRVTVTVDGIVVLDQDYEVNCFNNPAAEISFDCDNGIRVVLDNRLSPESQAFEVTGYDHTIEVEAGQTKTVTVEAPEGTTKTVTVKADGVLLDEDTFTVNCENEPAASVAYTCGDGIVVTLDNSDGAAPQDFVVNGTTVTVPAGGTETVTIPGDEDTDVLVEVTADGTVLVDETITVNCENEPAASVAYTCGDGIVVTLDNSTGATPQDFVVNGTTVTVPAGGTETVTIPGDEDTDVLVEVTADGTVLVDETITVNCENEPAATITWTCGSAITVVLDNSTGATPQDFDVNGTSYTVAAGAERTVTLPAPVEDGPAKTVTVSVGDGEDAEVIATETFQANCVTPPPPPAVDRAPAADSSWVCAEDVITVTLDNSDSDVSVTFTVNGTDVTVPAGQTEVVELDAPTEDGPAVSVTVTDGATTLVSESYQADCVQSETETPPTTTPPTTQPDEDVDVLDDSVQPDVKNQAPQVLNNRNVRTLPRTGSEPLDMALPALLVLLLGAGLVVLGKELGDA